MTMATPMVIALALCFAACATGIVLAALLRPVLQARVLRWLGGGAGVAAAVAGAASLFSGGGLVQTFWSVPGLATLTLRVDPLSAALVLVTGLVLLPGSIYAAGELRGGALRGHERTFSLMLLGLYASIVLILIAGDALTFLLAWEVMSVLCYLLVTSGPSAENGRQIPSGFLLLAMGEAGTLAAALGFLVLARGAGSLEFDALRAAAPGVGAGARWAVFLLTFFGFGVKAGLVPVNSWLQRAYTSAPRAFAPVLAGATLNLGLYGILRVNADLLPAAGIGPGLVALGVGSASALIGILYATTDNDLKAMLAHSSIENVGIVVAGLGAGMVFVAAGHPALAAIAFVAGLYHLLNHSLFKSLLFVGVGAVEARTGTRDMDRLGGLVKAMPLASIAFLAGVWSIAGLPPFNGFVSEWLTLQSLLRAAELGSTGAKLVFALCGAVLALTAALAVTCFVKVYAMSFLGRRRLAPERNVRDAAPSALGAMAILGALCLGLGVLPTYVIPMLDPASSQLAAARAAGAANGADRGPASAAITPGAGENRPAAGQSPSATAALVPPFFAPRPTEAGLPADFAAEFHDLGAQVGRGLLPGRGLVVLHRGGEANPVVFAMSTSYMLLALAILLLVTYVVLHRWLTSTRRLARRERWAGGLARLPPDFGYTATGFSNPVRVVFDAVFRPTTVEDTRETVAEHFRTAIRREKEQVHLVDRLVFRPVHVMTLRLARALAAMHHGRINAYATYAFLVLLIALAVLSAS